MSEQIHMEIGKKYKIKLPCSEDIYNYYKKLIFQSFNRTCLGEYEFVVRHRNCCGTRFRKEEQGTMP